MSWYHIPLNSIKIKDVVEGCHNAFLADLGKIEDVELLEVAAYRRKECDKCLQRDGDYCDANPNNKRVQHRETGEWTTGCGCNIKCKIFLLRSECPAKIWKAVEI